MQAVKGKGTGLERSLFAMLAGMRLSGWKRNFSDATGKPDAAFVSARVAIFVDGCFWHGCPHCNRNIPQTNREFWENKIRRTIERDSVNNEKLRQDGWTVIRIWGHEMKSVACREQIRRSIREALAAHESHENAADPESGSSVLSSL